MANSRLSVVLGGRPGGELEGPLLLLAGLVDPVHGHPVVGVVWEEQRGEVGAVRDGFAVEGGNGVARGEAGGVGG